MLEGRAWVANEFGAPGDVLHLVNRTWGKPPEGYLLIEVAAAGVALPDLMMTQGIYPLVPEPPVTPGQEACGFVVANGAGGRYKEGDRVFGPTAFYSGSGGLADYAFVKESQCSLAPPNLSDTEAAGFYIGFRTAYAALVERTGLKPGEHLVVLGGSGSTGATAIALGKALGAKVTAIASGADKLEFCKRIGADFVIDRRAGDVAKRIRDITSGDGADVIVDPVGGDLAAKAVEAVARFGRIAVIGFASGSWIDLNPLDMVLRNYSAVGVFAGGFTEVEDAEACAALCHLAHEEKLKVPMGKIYDFEDVPEMIDRMKDSSEPGKLTVRVREKSA